MIVLFFVLPPLLLQLTNTGASERSEGASYESSKALVKQVNRGLACS